MDLTGKTFGQYRVVRLLGRGGMGEVYEVEHTTLGRTYALKLLPEEFASQPDSLARFRREARVMAKLEHPHIVRVDDFGETAGRYWLRMELVKGVESKPESGKQKIEIKKEHCITLGDYAAQRGGQIEPAEFAVILKQMLEALAFAHDAGVVHRDLKPGNILLDRDARGRLLVKISDFGLARVMGDEFLRDQVRLSMSRSLSLGQAQTLGEEGSSTRALVGTWEYMSPEQRRGEAADARSDVYAVGLMCYRLLTGKGLGLKLPSELVSGLAPEWDQFITRALEQDAAARYAHGAAMLSAAAPLLGPAEDLTGSRVAESERPPAGEDKLEAETRRLAEAQKRAAAEALRAQAEEERRQRELRAQAHREELQRIRAAQQLRNEALWIKLAGVWGRFRVFLLSPLGVGVALVLALGIGVYWGGPVYRRYATARALRAQQEKWRQPAEAARQRTMEQSRQPSESYDPGSQKVLERMQQRRMAEDAETFSSMGFSNRQEFEAATRKAQEDAMAAQERRLNVQQAFRKFTARSPFVNSLGMSFVYASRTDVLFSIWETRVKDYAAYAASDSGVDDSWRRPGFTQNGEHPVVMVSYEDATKFCAWLTQKEQAGGRIGTNQIYRLPMDAEWSYAVGIRGPTTASPTLSYSGSGNQYPWGTVWPPPSTAGNYQNLQRGTRGQTAPVGQFAASRLGLYDLGGNVWEWCVDNPGAAQLEMAASNPSAPYSSSSGPGSPQSRYNPAYPGDSPSSPGYRPPASTMEPNGMRRPSVAGSGGPVLRGGSFLTSTYNQQNLLSSHREYKTSTDRQSDIGFRVVLAGEPDR